MYDIIIVGAGPAGLTAALYAGRANKKVLVLEKKVYGGQIINSSLIENYPGITQISGFDFATTIYKQVLELGVEVKLESVLKIEEGFKVVTSKNEYLGKAIILATGVSNKKLGLEDEDKFLGKGISYCATCDGAFFKNKTVAVVGGGNTSLEEALYLSNLAEKVYLIHRRDSFRGDSKYLDEIREKNNIEILYNSIITKLIGNDILESIEIETNKQKKILSLNGLFIAIGKVPDNQIFANIVSLTEDGYIESFDGVHTNHSKIYVAGDTRNKELRQLTTAVGDGALAATYAIKEMED